MKKIKKIFKSIFSSRKATFSLIAAILSFSLLIGVTTAWFVSIVSRPVGDITTGNIDYVGKFYTANGDLVKDSNFTKDDNGATLPSMTKLPEENWRAGSFTTFYISLEKTGTLDMDYALSFEITGDEKALKNRGIYWYNVTKLDDVSDALHYDVYNPPVGDTALEKDYSTVIKDYIADSGRYEEVKECNDENCPKDQNGKFVNHTCTENKSTSMINMDRFGVYGVLTDQQQQNKHINIIRVDLGMYRNAKPESYTEQTLNLKAKFFVTQKGAMDNSNGEGATFYVTDQSTLKNAMELSLPGDSIILAGSFAVDYDVIFNKPVNIKTQSHTMTINGNLKFDFLSPLHMSIDLTGGGKILVKKKDKAGGDLIFNTTNTPITFNGAPFRNADDTKKAQILVEGTFYVKASNSTNTSGFKIKDVNIAKEVNTNDEALVYNDIFVDSYTRLVIEQNVHFNRVICCRNSTDVYIKNLGIVDEVDATLMKFVDEEPIYTTYFSDHPQLTIANYSNNNIDAEGKLKKLIVKLPEDAMPFAKLVEPIESNLLYKGNTRIIREWNASEISIIPNDLPNYKVNDIEDKNKNDVYVEKINNDPTRLKINYRNKILADGQTETTTIKDLLAEFFGGGNVNGHNTVKELVIQSIGNKEVTNEDITFINSLQSLRVLNLENAILSGRELKAEAFKGNPLLETIILPITLEKIATKALYSIPNLKTITIPDSVTSIASNALNGITFVYLEGNTPPTIAKDNLDVIEHAGDNKPIQSYYFVGGVELGDYLNYVETYQNAWPDFKNYIYVMGYITDDGYNVVREIKDPYSNDLAGWELVLTINSSKTIKAGCDHTGANLQLNRNRIDIVSVGTHALSHLPNEFDLSFTQSVRKIRAGAVSRSKVKSVTFHNGIEEIYAGAFFDCEYLTYIDLNKVKHIRSAAFYGCTNLVYADLGDLETIGEALNTKGTLFGTFGNCPNLIAIDAYKLTSVCPHCLDGTENVKIIRLYDQLVSNIANIKPLIANVVMTSNARVYIDTSLLENYKFLDNNRTNTLYRICPLGYLHGNNIIEVEGLGALSNEGVIAKVNIGEYCFVQNKDFPFTCELVASLLLEINQPDYTVPDKVVATEHDSFYVEIRNEKIIEKNPYTYEPGTYTVKKVRKFAYYSTKFTNVNLTFPADITEVGFMAFSNENGLITIPKSSRKYEKEILSINFNNVVRVGARSFEHVRYLKKIDRNNHIVEVGEGAFQGCPDLTEVYLPDVERFTVDYDPLTNESHADTNTFKDCKSLVILDCGVNFNSIAGYGFIVGAKNLHQFILRTTTPLTGLTSKYFIDERMNKYNIPNLRIYASPMVIFNSFMEVIISGTLNPFYEVGTNIGTYNVQVQNSVGKNVNVNIGEYTIVEDYVDFRTPEKVYKGASISSYNVHPANIKPNYIVPDSFGSDYGFNTPINVVRFGTNLFAQFPFEKMNPHNNTQDTSKENFTIPKYLVCVGPYAFAFTKVRFSNFLAIEEIGDNAFEGCNNMYLIDAPSLKSIAYNTFSKMENVRKIDAPLLEIVGKNAMVGLKSCEYIYTNVHTVNYQATSGARPEGNWYDNSETLKCIYLCNDNRVEYLLNFDIVNDKVVTITASQNILQRSKIKLVYDSSIVREYSRTDTPNRTVNLIDDGAVITYTMPEYLIDEPSVAKNEEIGLYRFFSSAFTATDEIPKQFQYVGEQKIYYVTSINSHCFNGVVFDEAFKLNLTDYPRIHTIGDKAFFNSQLKGDVNLASVTSVGSYAFANNSITSVVGNSIIYLGVGAFANNTTTLSKATFNTDNLNSLPDELFANDTVLTDLYINNLIEVTPTTFSSKINNQLRVHINNNLVNKPLSVALPNEHKRLKLVFMKPGEPFSTKNAVAITKLLTLKKGAIQYPSEPQNNDGNPSTGDYTIYHIDLNLVKKNLTQTSEIPKAYDLYAYSSVDGTNHLTKLITSTAVKFTGWDNYQDFTFYVSLQDKERYIESLPLKHNSQETIHKVEEEGILFNGTETIDGKTYNYQMTFRRMITYHSKIEQDVEKFYEKEDFELFSFVCDSGITTLTLPNRFTITKVGNKEYANATNAEISDGTGGAPINYDLVSIANGAFLSQSLESSITKIYINKSYRFYHEEVFCDLSSLENFEVDPANEVYEESKTTFWDPNRTTGILCSKGINADGWDAFIKTQQIIYCYPRAKQDPKISILSSAKFFVRGSAFKNAHKLKEVTFEKPADRSFSPVMVIGANAFEGTKLISLTIEHPSLPLVIADDIFDKNNKDITIYVPNDQNLLKQYRSDPVFGKYKIMIIGTENPQT